MPEQNDQEYLVTPLETILYDLINSIDMDISDVRTKVFMSIIDHISSIEAYTLFTKRTIDETENFIFTSVEHISLMLELSMRLNAYLEDNKDAKEEFLNYLTGMYNSLSLINNEILPRTVEFLKQVYTDEKNIVSVLMNSWYKVIVLIYFYKYHLKSYILSQQARGN